MSTADLHAWMERALTDELEARAVAKYLADHPGTIKNRPDEERWGLELAWMGLWRRLTGEAPFSQEF